ncbi:hypothetical protein UY3_06368 [Chelonia mydas]|uniref:Uncharacterized protein n=1 Tax=Chelonia mydas TaxID=8469 RepID=M7BEM5_CHEMY|nr:hypothetical protein UY3_06368 [Chelonia mydas]
MGAAGSGSWYVPRPAPFPTAPISLQQRTVASGSRDRPNLRPQQMPYYGKHGARSAQFTITAAVVSWVLLSADSAVGLLTIVIRCNSALLLL